MKRLASLIFASLLAVFALSGCAGFDLSSLSEPIVKVAESVTDENTSTAKGATAGMSSSDAANVLMTRDYYGAVKAVAGAGKDKASLVLVEFESHDGKPITIDAKRFKVYAPPASGGAAQLAIQPPKEVESNGIKWAREIRQGLAQVFIPWAAINENGQNTRYLSDNATAVRQTELGVIGASVTGSQGIASQAITNFAPLVVEVPAPTAP